MVEFIKRAVMVAALCLCFTETVFAGNVETNGEQLTASEGFTSEQCLDAGPLDPPREIAPWTYAGAYKLTFYCPCRRCCGSWSKYHKTACGTTPAEGRTIACGSLPFGTRVLINGHEYVVEDRGVTGNHIDIYLESHAECLRAGVQYADIYIR